MREWTVEKVSAVSMNCVQVGGKETKDTKKKNLYTWVKALICKWSSYWKHIENGFSKQDAAWGLKPVELTVHISKGCVCFLFTALYIVHRSLYHMHLKIKMCMKAKSPSNVKREKAFIFLSPFSRELLTFLKHKEIRHPFVKKAIWTIWSNCKLKLSRFSF